MIYKFLKWYAILGLKFYYKNIFIQYDPELPGKYPVIYASNHPAGFYESLLFATISKYAPIFLVRSDYVTIKGLMWIFRILKLYPIYRQKEGLKNVSKNNEVFRSLYKELENHTPVCIYPEGTTKFNFRIRPIKKGISRLALGAKKYGLQDIQILPIAFNYVEPAKFRSDIFILSGSSMDLFDFNDEDLDNPASLRKLTIEIEEQMRKVAIDLKTPEQHNLFKQLQLLIVNNSIAGSNQKPYVRNSEIPKKIKNLSNLIKDLDDKSLSILENKSNEYFEQLSSIKSNDKAVTNHKNTFVNSIKIFLGYPLYIIGIIVNAIPVLFALNIRKNKIKQYEYKAVVTVLIAQFAYILYFIILILLSTILFSTKGLIVVIFPFLAWFSLKYYDFKHDYFATKNFHNSSKKEKLRELRKEIENLASTCIGFSFVIFNLFDIWT